MPLPPAEDPATTSRGDAAPTDRARLRALFDHGELGIAITSPQRGFLEVNDRLCAMLGHARADLTTTTVPAILHPDDLAADRAALERVERGEAEGYTLDQRFVRKDGSVRWALVSVCAVRAARGEIDALLVVCADLEERRHADEERARIERNNRQLVKAESLGRMAGAIAHHFNNQLHVVLTALELVRHDLEPGARAHEDIRAAEEAARKAIELSGVMRTYLGWNAAARRRVDLSAACTAALARVTARGEAGAKVELALASPGPVVMAEVQLLEQAVVHLVTNALEALDEAPRTIRLAVGEADARALPADARFPVDFEPEPGPYAWIEVEDSGRGIAARDLERIFDPFFTTKQLGRGIGLAVVLGLARSERGAVVVERRQGGGTRFRMFLPLADSTPEAPGPIPTPSPLDAGTVLRWVEALCAGDTRTSYSMVLELLDRGLTPRVVAGDLFREALATIGERWERGECTVATEHRACDIVTSLLPLVFPSGASLARIGRRVVVACPRGERDALGARVVGHVLEARGWEVVQLGGDAPAASIVAEVGRAPTHLVAISVAVASHVGSALDAVEALRAAGVDAPIAIGGEGVHAIPQGRLARLGHVHALGTLAALEERLPGWERPR